MTTGQASAQRRVFLAVTVTVTGLDWTVITILAESRVTQFMLDLISPIWFEQANN